MADKIVNIIYAILFVAPLFFSILCLLKLILVDWPNKKRLSTAIAKAAAIVPLISIPIFLIYFVAVNFIFTSVEIPYLLNLIGTILFLLYFGTFFGLAYGLGTLGHGGISPKVVVIELYNLFFKKGKNSSAKGDQNLNCE